MNIIWTPLKIALGIIAAVVLGFLVIKGYGMYEASKSNQQKTWERSVDSAATVRAEKLKAAAVADTVYQQGETVYVRGRDVLLNPGPGKPPATPEVRACFVLANSSRALCQRRHEADTAALHATERELELWKAKPSGIQRVQAYGEGMYDVAHQVPVIRAGATARLFGPLSLSVAGEYAAPPAGKSSPAFRALAGVRVNF